MGFVYSRAGFMSAAFVGVLAVLVSCANVEKPYVPSNSSTSNQEENSNGVNPQNKEGSLYDWMMYDDLTARTRNYTEPGLVRPYDFTQKSVLQVVEQVHKELLEKAPAIGLELSAKIKWDLMNQDKSSDHQSRMQMNQMIKQDYILLRLRRYAGITVKFLKSPKLRHVELSPEVIRFNWGAIRALEFVDETVRNSFHRRLDQIKIHEIRIVTVPYSVDYIVSEIERPALVGDKSVMKKRQNPKMPILMHRGGRNIWVIYVNPFEVSAYTSTEIHNILSGAQFERTELIHVDKTGFNKYMIR